MPTDGRSLTPENAERLSFVCGPFFDPLGDEGSAEESRGWTRAHVVDVGPERTA